MPGHRPMDPITAKQIAQLVQVACIREVCAPKPGNVSRQCDFQDTTLEDFILSAIAIGPVFENIGKADIGQTVLEAVKHTRRWVQSNTNPWDYEFSKFTRYFLNMQILFPTIPGILRQSSNQP